MSIDILSEYINYLLIKLNHSGVQEVELVKQFEEKMRLDIGPKFSSLVRIRTGFIHQKPYAFFDNPNRVCGKLKTELGDILFVVKIFNKDKDLIDHRASFCQVKVEDKSKNWTVTSHQIAFFTNLDKITFRFGNKVTKNAGYSPIKINVSKIDPWFSHYLFISGNINLGIDSLDVGLKYKNDCKNYNVSCCLNNDNASCYLKFCPQYSFDKFFKKFLVLRGVGFNVNNQFSLVDIIYKRLGMQIDPPIEYDGYFEESNNGFALIEFNLVSQ